MDALGRFVQMDYPAWPRDGMRVSTRASLSVEPHHVPQALYPAVHRLRPLATASLKEKELAAATRGTLKSMLFAALRVNLLAGWKRVLWD